MHSAHRHPASILLFALLCLVGLSTHVRAQTHDVQWWPDTQLSIRITPQLSGVFLANIRFGRDVTATVTQQYGAGLNWAIHRQLTGAVQYRYVISDPTEGRHSLEHRFQVDLTPRLPLSHGVTLVNRWRAEYRRLGGTTAGRFSERLQFERNLSIHDHKFTPYVAGESYFDTRTHAFSRNRILFGARTPVNKHLTLDTFYMHQWDARAKPGFWHVIGTYLRFEI